MYGWIVGACANNDWSWYTLIVIYLYYILLKELSNLGLNNFDFTRPNRPTHKVKIGQLYVWKFLEEYIFCLYNNWFIEICLVNWFWSNSEISLPNLSLYNHAFDLWFGSWNCLVQNYLSNSKIGAHFMKKKAPNTGESSGQSANISSFPGPL